MKLLFVLCVFLGLSADCCAEVPTRKIRVACVGDSITWGYAMTNQVEESYPTHLQRILGDGYEVRNFGDPGAGVYRDPKPTHNGWVPHPWRTGKQDAPAYAFEPDIVVGGLGINDAQQFVDEYRCDTDGKPLTERGLFCRQYVELLEAFRAKGRHPRYILWTRLCPTGKVCWLKDRPNAFLMEADLKRVAERMDAEQLDMYTPLMPYVETPHFAPDGVHPEGMAQKRIAEVTAKQILNGKKGR